MLLTKEVEVRPTGKMIQYYKNLGYDAKHKQPLMVKVKDLPEHSDKMVDILCDYCEKEIISMKYSDYTKGAKNIEKHACKNCRYEKIKEVTKKLYNTDNIGSLIEFQEKKRNTVLARYNVDNYAKTDECKEKYKKTMLLKYGVDNPSKNPFSIEKRKRTNLERYGYEYNLQSPEIREKILNTCLMKYGYTNPSQVPEIREKIEQTLIDRYGVSNLFMHPDIQSKIKQVFLEKYGTDSPNKNPEVRKKTAKTLYKNSSQMCSKQQLFLYDFYSLNSDNVELNYPISRFNVDICFPEEKLYIEYDGGFHNAQVKLGDMTQEEFNHKEIVRNSVIKREGYKQMRIISSKDYLPSDSILLQMLEHTRQYFSENPERSWIEYNIDTSTVRNALQKDGVFFDYGNLRKINKSA